MRKDMQEKLKQLRKNYYEHGIIDKEGMKSLETSLNNAKKEKREQRDIEFSYNKFKKEVLED